MPHIQDDDDLWQIVLVERQACSSILKDNNLEEEVAMEGCYSTPIIAVQRTIAPDGEA